jgi:Flp pilus assembly pilin Flp
MRELGVLARSDGIARSAAKRLATPVNFLWRRWRDVRETTLLSRVSDRLRRFGMGEDALSITEYGMLVAFAALALIALAAVFGTQISGWFASKTGSITTV